MLGLGYIYIRVMLGLGYIRDKLTQGDPYAEHITYSRLVTVNNTYNHTIQNKLCTALPSVSTDNAYIHISSFSNRTVLFYVQGNTNIQHNVKTQAIAP